MMARLSVKSLIVKTFLPLLLSIIITTDVNTGTSIYRSSSLYHSHLQTNFSTVSMQPVLGAIWVVDSVLVWMMSSFLATLILSCQLPEVLSLGPDGEIIGKDRYVPLCKFLHAWGWALLSQLPLLLTSWYIILVAVLSEATFHSACPPIRA